MDRSEVRCATSGFGSRRRARERAEREHAILCAAERVIGRHGFHDAGICEIAREAEYAIGTLYGLFPSKEALCERLVESRAEELSAAMRAAVEARGTLRERLERAFEAKLGFFVRHQSFLRIYASASSMATSSWAAPPRAAQARAENLRGLIRTFTAAQRRGALDRGASAVELALAFQSLSTTFLVEAVRDGGELDPLRARQAMQRVFFDRVLGPPGARAPRRAPVPAARARRTSGAAAGVVLAALLLGCASRAAADATAPTGAATIDLEQAYDRALATDQSIRSAAEAIAKADLLPWRGLTRVAPRLTGNGRYSKPEHDIESSLGPTRVETRSATLTVEWPLLDFTAIPAYQQGTLGAEAARLQYRFAVRNALFGVAEAYFEVLKQARVVEIGSQTLDLAKGQLTLAERRFQVGEVTKTDVLRARVVVEQGNQLLIQATNDLALARHTLASVLNLSDGDAFQVVEPAPLTAAPPPLAEAAQTASMRREDLRASELVIEQQAERHREVLAEYVPKVVGSWTDQWIEPETFSTRNDFWEATVNLQVPFFEGGERELDLADTNHDTERARIARESLGKSVDLEVRDAWLAVHTLEETLTALRAQVAAAEENFRDLQNQYRAGEATSLDLQSALTDLARSRTDLATRTFDLEVARRNLDRAVGTFQDARVEKVDIR